MVFSISNDEVIRLADNKFVWAKRMQVQQHTCHGILKKIDVVLEIIDLLRTLIYFKMKDLTGCLFRFTVSWRSPSHHPYEFQSYNSYRAKFMMFRTLTDDFMERFVFSED